jgi:L-ascorbate metabolism protein UlaG (beta-lactamase superfamily)
VEVNLLRIRWHGHSCFEVTNDISLVTDPLDGKLIGIPTPNVSGDIILISHDHYYHNNVESVEKKESTVKRDEKEETVLEIQIKRVKSFHDESGGAKHGENIIYLFSMDDISFCHLDDLGHELDEDAVQQI